MDSSLTVREFIKKKNGKHFFILGLFTNFKNIYGVITAKDKLALLLLYKRL